ncbi:sensor histidine kinase [Paenibacillus alba]|uniref:Histidine kinase n=1 Tax=Paenibacillus alba TaxID=1197127 RepID=A0ABU6FZR8_9BACL|nr:histidine kinase [Paenibacillus alba]MEC0227393.1 histidine kinase [Paenibacillus alba]
MKLWNKLRSPWKISTVLYVLLFVMVVMPVASLSVLILQIYKQDLLQQTTDQTLQTLRALTYSAEQEIGRAVYISAAIGVDPEVLRSASMLKQATAADRQTYITSLNKTLARYSSSIPSYLLSIHFFFKDSGMYSYNRNLIPDEQSMRHSIWYHKTLEKQDEVQIQGLQKNVLYDTTDKYVISTAFSPSFMQGLQDVEMIYFTFSRDRLENILRQYPYSPSSFMILSDQTEIVATSFGLSSEDAVKMAALSNISASKEGQFITTMDGQKMLITFTSAEVLDWKICQIVPYKELTKNYNNIYKFVMIATFLGTILFLIISFYLVRSLTKPLLQLVRKMSRVMEGNLNAKIEASGSAETVILGHTFNYMLDQIQLLIIEREKEEREKRKAEFTALQSQINPHFLMNTLNAIKLMALINKVDNIRNMTVALMRLLTSSFNRGGNLTLVSEEIENLKSYFYIMEIRYGKKFEVIWEIEEQVSSAYMLKLLLQPILENCIIHGLSGTETNSRIHIIGRASERSVSIVIADNGSGVSEEQILQFNASKTGQEHTFTGMGIANVHHRIILHYGQEYGVTIEPNLPTGTKVTLLIPLIRQDEENIKDHV